LGRSSGATLVVLLAVQVVAAWGLAAAAPTRWAPGLALGLGALAVALGSLAPAVAFALLVFVLLGLGLAAVAAEAWGWPGVGQARLIAAQLALLALLVAAWLQAAAVRSLEVRASQAEARVRELEKYDEGSGVYAAREFFDRLRDMVTRMHRRGEEGYLLVLRVALGRRDLEEAAMARLGRVVAASLRAHYDLVGRIQPSTLAVALHAVDPSGREVVLARLRQAVAAAFAPAIWTGLDVSGLPLSGSWDAVSVELRRRGLLEGTPPLPARQAIRT